MSFVYGMLAKGEGGKVFVKFGYSDDVDKRTCAVQTGCPLEIIKVFRVDAKQHAISIERYLHSFFGHRLSSGEWFLFDLSDEKQKDEFSRGCWQAFTVYLGSEWDWVETAPGDRLRQLRDMRRKKLMNSAKHLEPLKARRNMDPRDNFWMDGGMWKERM